MPTKKETIEKLLGTLSAAGPVRFRAMFGEYALYHDDKVVGFVCDDTLFMKPSPIGDSFLDASHGAPAYPGSKDYLKVPADKLSDALWLSRFVQETAEALPAPKPKAKK